VVLLLVAALPWLLVARTMGNARPVGSHTAPNAIVWADRVFGSERELATWLRSRGGSYRDWAANHPGLYRILAHKPAAPATTTPVTTTRATATTAGAPTHASPARIPSARGVAAFVKSIVWLLAKVGAIVLALALLVFALGPDPVVARLSPRSGLAFATVELRIAAAAAAISLATGIFAAYLLG
jgi:hypothetical protein